MSVGLNVPITSSWDGKGVKHAAKELGALDSLASKLTKRLAGAFTVGAIGKFAKDSVNAFTQANKQFTVMSQTLNNLGLSVGITKLEDFFNRLELQFGKDKSVLIPAFQTLINSTHDYAKSQQLLNLALDVSAGSGKDLGEVSMALGKAYVGQTTALTRLGVGLSAANIKGKSFIDIQKQLTAQFSGAAASAADTYQGKIDKLKVTFDNMKETIGKGIITGLEQAFSGNNITGFQNAMEHTATYVSNIAIGLGVIGQKIADIFSMIPKPILNNLGVLFPLKNLLSDLGKKNQTQANNMLASLADPVAEGLANYKNRLKAAQTAKDAAAAAAKDLAAQKAITDQKKKQLELQKAKAVLDQASKILNLDQAEVVAAMMNESLTQNEMLRLELKKSLLDDNAKSAASFAQQLVASQVAALQLAASNPFGLINADIMSAIKSLQEFAAALAALSEMPPTITRLGGLAAFQAKVAAVPSYESYASPWQFGGASADPVFQSTNAQGVTVTIIDATTGGVNTITQNNSLSGTPATVSRVNPFGAGFNS